MATQSCPGVPAPDGRPLLEPGSCQVGRPGGATRNHFSFRRRRAGLAEQSGYLHQPPDERKPHLRYHCRAGEVRSDPQCERPIQPAGLPAQSPGVRRHRRLSHRDPNVRPAQQFRHRRRHAKSDHRRERRFELQPRPHQRQSERRHRIPVQSGLHRRTGPHADPALAAQRGHRYHQDLHQGGAK